MAIHRDAELLDDDKPLSFWTERLRSPSAAEREQAACVLGRLGPAAHPAIADLSDALDDRQPGVRKRAALALGQIGPAAVPLLVKAVSWGGGRNLVSAAYALGRIGPDAREAVPSLLQCFHDINRVLSRTALVALGRIGPAAGPIVPELLATLRSPQWRPFRDEAALALSRFGSAALPALVRALAEDDPELRFLVIEALGQMGPTAEAAVPALTEAQQHADRSVCWRATRALSRIRPPIPVLVAALRNGHREVRKRSARLLVRLGPAGIQALFTHPEASVRQEALTFLGRQHGFPEGLIPALIDRLQDQEVSVRREAIKVIDRLGAAEHDPAVVLALMNCLEDAAVAVSAAATLGRMGSAARAALPALLARLPQSDAPTRAALVEALGRIPDEEYGPAFVTALVTAVGDADPAAAAAAMTELGRMGPAVQPAISALLARLQDGKVRVRAAAIQALGRIVTAGCAPAVISALSSALADADTAIAVDAATILGGLGPTAVPALVAAVQASEERIRAAAIDALRRIGAAEALPAILAALKDSSGAVRGAAVEAVDTLGPDELALSALVAALKDDAPQVRDAAVTALRRRTLALRAVPGLAELCAPELPDEILGQLGPEVVPELLRRLRESDSYTYDDQLVSILGGMGADARGALEQLRDFRQPRFWNRQVNTYPAVRAIESAVKREDCCRHFRPEWRTENVRALARTALEGAAEVLPILADALEDAGCTDEDLLGYCRKRQADAAGRWMLELILGRD